MIGYATLGTNDLDHARAFYDAWLGELGAKRMIEVPDAQGLTMYGVAMDQPMLAVTRPYDGGTASPGNGPMLALPMPSRAQVDALHARALDLGATDEGAPGLREPASFGFYGAYFRDPDGNKIALFKLGGE